MVATPHIAIGVDNVNDAVDYYSRVMGFEVTNRDDDHVELASGILKLYVCRDDGHGPCFNVEVEDIVLAEEILVRSGARVFSRSQREVCVQDKFGHNFCLTPQL